MIKSLIEKYCTLPLAIAIWGHDLPSLSTHLKLRWLGECYFCSPAFVLPALGVGTAIVYVYLFQQFL